MTIVALEWLTYGLRRLAAAAEARGLQVELLTADPEFYAYELGQGPLKGLTVTVLDTFDDEVVSQRLAQIPELQGLISTTDTWNLRSIGLRAKFALAGPDADAVTLTRSKYHLRKLLFEEGLSSSPSRLFSPQNLSDSSAFDGLVRPFVIKDNAGTGSRNVWLVRTEAEAGSVRQAIQESNHQGELTAESYFFGPMYSVETLSWDGETRILGTTSRILSSPPVFREEGEAFPIVFPSPQQGQLESWIAKILQTIGYTDGFAHTEFIVTRDGFEVVEINSRLAGGLIGEAMCQALEVNLYDAFLDLAMNRRPSLMDAEPVGRGAFAMINLYAPSVGTFVGLEGIEDLKLQPGEPVLYPKRRAGDPVASLVDYRGIVGTLLASGENSELAMHNARSAAGQLRIGITPPSVWG